MSRRMTWILLTTVLLFAFVPSRQVQAQLSVDPGRRSLPQGSSMSGRYENLFVELLGNTETEVRARIDSAFQRLFYGDDSTERVYYPVGPDMAYIEDILHDDVRTEGMSYGMMIAVQLDKKQEFDRLWKWTKTHMQHSSGPYKTFFGWHCTTNGALIDPGVASDGEEWFVTALLFAAARWGNGEGVYDYQAEAQAILDAMLNKESSPENDGTVTNMFSRLERQVVFSPSLGGAGFTDPSYHLPHFYELWSEQADKNNAFWSEAASTSRRFLKRAAHQMTGLTSDYARFDGSPIDPWHGGHADFRFDAWRVAMNVAVDYAWFARDPWAVTQSDRLLAFFHAEGIKEYGNQYTLDGRRLSADHSTGLVAMNAVACLASRSPFRREFVEELWLTPVPRGPARYYDGLLYMLGVLQVSGNFRMYRPAHDGVK